MSTHRKGPMGRLEWLTSEMTAMKGMFGSLAFMFVFECGAAVMNIEHVSMIFGIPINWHFVNAAILFILDTGVLVWIIFHKPILLGLEEQREKLFYIQWRNKTRKIDEYLKQEEQDLDEQNPEEQSPLEHRATSASTHVYTASDVGGTGTVPVDPEIAELESQIAKKKRRLDS